MHALLHRNVSWLQAVENDSTDLDSWSRGPILTVLMRPRDLSQTKHIGHETLERTRRAVRQPYSSMAGWLQE